MAREYTTRTLREIVRIVASRFLGMLVICAILVGSVTTASLLAPKWYRSETQILVRPERAMDPLEKPGSLRDRVSLFIITQREIIASDHVLGTAMMRLEKKTPQPGSLKGPSSAYLPWYSDRDVENYIRQNTRYLKKVRKRINVETPGGPETTFTQVFTITTDWCETREKPSLSTTISRTAAANKTHRFAKFLVEAYLKRRTQLESERTRAQEDFLSQERLQQAESQLQQVQRTLQTFIATEVKGDLPLLVAMRKGGSGIESGVARLTTEFQSEINRLDADIAAFKVLKDAVDKQQNRKNPAEIAIPDAVIPANPLLVTLQEKILDLKLQINAMTPRYEEEYRQLKNIRQELASALNDLRAEVKKQSERLGQRIVYLEAQRRVLNAKLREHRKDADVLASKAARYEELQRKVENAETIYHEVHKQVLNAEAARKAAEGKNPFLVTVLDAPSIPDPEDPRRPILWLNIVVGVAVGLVLALIYAFLADHFDHTIKGIDDAERYLGAQVLGSVPKFGRKIIRIP